MEPDAGPEENDEASAETSHVRLSDPTASGESDEGPKLEHEEELGRGGMGVVLKAHDNDLGRDVAMKLLRAEHAGNANVVERFVEEAQVAGQLQHPGVLPVYGLEIRDDGRLSVDGLLAFQAWAKGQGLVDRELTPEEFCSPDLVVEAAEEETR